MCLRASRTDLRYWMTREFLLNLLRNKFFRHQKSDNYARFKKDY